MKRLQEGAWLSWDDPGRVFRIPDKGPSPQRKEEKRDGTF
jgi:hypothetical protein